MEPGHARRFRIISCKLRRKSAVIGFYTNNFKESVMQPLLCRKIRTPKPSPRIRIHFVVKTAWNAWQPPWSQAGYLRRRRCGGNLSYSSVSTSFCQLPSRLMCKHNNGQCSCRQEPQKALVGTCRSSIQ